MSTVFEYVRRFFAWPSKPGNAYAPWPVVVRRLLFCPIFYAGLVLAFAGLVLGWGLDVARQFWRDAT